MDRLRDLTLSPAQRFLVGIALGLLLIAGIIGFQYRAVAARQHELGQQFATLQRAIDQLNQTNALDGTPGPTAFPPNPPNLELARLVLASATSSGVQTSPLQAGIQGTDTVGTGTYRTVTLHLTVSGSLPQVLDFFDRVERGNIKTLTLDNLQLESTDGRWTAQVQIIAYAQPG